MRPKSGHNFDVLGGYTAQIKYDNNLSITGRGYTLDELTWNNMAAVPDKQNTSISTNHNDWTKMSVLGRLNYNYKERYYVTFTARYDGASNFAANKKWGFFPSAAVRWNIANEKFLQKAAWIDELALRASLGRTGNDAISAYRSLAAVSNSTSGYLLGGTQQLQDPVGALNGVSAVDRQILTVQGLQMVPENLGVGLFLLGCGLEDKGHRL